MYNVVLIGPSGIGKTTIGNYISKVLNLELIDTDAWIEKSEGKSIEEIFKYNGEKYFRKLEKKLVRDIYYKENKIISTGGGIILNSVNMKLLQKKGLVFLLYGSVETIVNNIEFSNINRPLIDCQDSIYTGVKELLNDRKNMYFEYSDYVIYVDNKSIKEIGDEIINILRKI